MNCQNLGDYFSQIVKKNQFRNALIFDDKKISFYDLDKFSEKILFFLERQNLKKGDIVCISSIKNEYTFYVLIACLKGGFPYVFLDRKSPKSRLDKIINQIKPKIVFVDDNFPKVTCKKIIKLKKIKNLKQSKILSLKKKIRINEYDKAYIMFTSGSTGTPKGAVMSHKNVINFINWAKIEYKVTPNDIFTNLNPLFFDNSVFDIYASIFNGASLVPISRDKLLEPYKIIRFLNKKKITFWFSVPSLIIYFLSFDVLNIKNLSSVKKIIFGGEGFPKKILFKLFKTFNKASQIFNVYGPTECTCICSSYQISKKDFYKNEILKLAPLGKKMIKYFKFFIIKKKELAKLGEIGELHLCGENVGLGYINNTVENKKRFYKKKINHKINSCYKTGDLVYRDKINKNIYFASRKDEQIKYKGYRIELGEIENNLNSLSKVKQSIVCFGMKNGIEEITCWLVSSYKNSFSIIKDLEKLIPKYMIPHKFINLNSFPKNANGKINKKQIKISYYD